MNRGEKLIAERLLQIKACSISFIHLVVCHTTGPKPLPNRALHIERSRASSFNREYPLLSLRSSSSFLRFLPRLFYSIYPTTKRYAISRRFQVYVFERRNFEG